MINWITLARIVYIAILLGMGYVGWKNLLALSGKSWVWTLAYFVGGFILPHVIIPLGNWGFYYEAMMVPGAYLVGWLGRDIVDAPISTSVDDF